MGLINRGHFCCVFFLFKVGGPSSSLVLSLPVSSPIFGMSILRRMFFPCKI